MNRHPARTVTALSGSVLAAGILTAGLAASPMAVADPPAGTAADAVVQHLKDEGYNVQFNMPSNMILSRCTVNGINGLTVMMAPDGSMSMMMAPGSANSTVYVDLNCPNSNN